MLHATAVLLTTCLAMTRAGLPTNPYPIPKDGMCTLPYSQAFTYGRHFPDYNWKCQDTEFTNLPYPKEKIDGLLGTEQYIDFRDTLKVTGSCVDFNDDFAKELGGQNPYYTWESMCKMKRYPVNVVWAKPDGVVVPPHFMGLNNGLLPCHVLPGQHLYDIDCIHPWSDNPKVADIGLARRLQRFANRWTETKRHLCLYGYMYNPAYVCKPSGYMTRYVLVYSPHLHLIFKAAIPDVPTSCECAKCNCLPQNIGYHSRRI
ncbi:hypothetical protein DPMN_045227 [Dreissena polymorpha]|uniref:Uncharacterized protein n=1 Tax=Dreissena polymorpha TaxID=45954 RepID=A0A9D4D5Z3_DREPO|nr:hypothetical protein DPMN_045227 [Dreissena polymorpha]